MKHVLVGWLILGASLSSSGATPSKKGCCPSFEKMKKLHIQVEKETILEALALLSMTTKSNIKNRIQQVPRSVLEDSLSKLERTHTKLKAITESARAHPSVKKAVSVDLLNRMRYLINKIKETLKEYERGDRGGRGHMGHAGTSQKARKAKMAKGRADPAQRLEEEDALDEAAEELADEIDTDYDHALNQESEDDEGVFTGCKSTAEAACKNASKKGAFLSAAVVIEDSEIPSDHSKGAALENFTKEHMGKKYLVHPKQAKGLHSGDIFCVKAVKPETQFGRKIVYGQKASASCPA